MVRGLRGLFKFFIAILIAIGATVGLIVAAFGLVIVTTPNPENIKGCIITEMYKVRLCSGDTTYAPFKQISPYLRNAVIASEDSTFYTHHGFDFFEIRNSFEKNLAKGEFARGGSTITQQLAKNVYLSADKSLLRKLREVLITIQLEKILTKDQILEKYLNVVEFGENLYGVGPAAQYYFKKKPAQLNPAEAAWLAFLLPSPKKYSVSFRKKQLTPFARSQTRIIVKRLAAFKMINASLAEESLERIDSLFGGQALVGSGDDSATAPSAEEMGEPDEWVQDFEAARKKAIDPESATLPAEPTVDDAPPPDDEPIEIEGSQDSSSVLEKEEERAIEEEIN